MKKSKNHVHFWSAGGVLYEIYKKNKKLQIKIVCKIPIRDIEILTPEEEIEVEKIIQNIKTSA